MKKLLIAFSFLMLAACGQEETTKEKQNAEVTAQEEPSSPPVSQEQPNPVAASEKFQWDFSEQKSYVYSFSQTTKGNTKMGVREEKTDLTGVGKLQVQVKNDYLANLSLTDIEMEVVNFDQNGQPAGTTNQKSEPLVVQDMKEDGSFENLDSDMLFDVLMPIPSKDLEVGDSELIPMKMAFSATGPRLFATGFNQVTFQGYEEIAGRKCAVLKGNIDISNLQIPPEASGQYECSTTGNATYYIDLEEKIYVGGDVHMAMKAVMDSGNGMSMEMVTDNQYKFRLEGVE